LLTTTVSNPDSFVQSGLKENICQARHRELYQFSDRSNTLAPIFSEFLGESRPALTGIGVAYLASPETLVEIEAVASLK
jgi:enamine deaminase RidA (YjgF/YER057c/UK114 family)